MVLPLGGVNESHFNAAKALLEKFDLVIPLEHITSELARSIMDANLGWHVEDTAKATNKNEHAIKFSPDDVARVREVNRFDMALYDYFAKQYEIFDAPYEDS